VENIGQKRTFTYKLTTNCNFQTPSLFKLTCHRMESIGLWDIKGSERYMVKVSHETGSVGNFVFRGALMPSYL